MAKATRICKVCGKEYGYCKTWNSPDKFRWQDVACSRECGEQYFRQVLEARGELPKEETAPKQTKKRIKKVIEEAPVIDTDDILDVKEDAKVEE